MAGMRGQARASLEPIGPFIKNTFAADAKVFLTMESK
jgi:hypothetical protein